MIYDQLLLQPHFVRHKAQTVCYIVCAMISCFFGLGAYLTGNYGVIFSLTPRTLRVWTYGDYYASYAQSA